MSEARKLIDMLPNDIFLYYRVEPYGATDDAPLAWYQVSGLRPVLPCGYVLECFRFNADGTFNPALVSLNNVGWVELLPEQLT